MKEYELSREAQHDLKEIRKYSKEHWGIKQAKIYLSQLRQQMYQLAEMPTLGQHRPDLDKDVYSYPCASHMIYFTITNQGIAIAGILHKRMLPERHLKI